MSEDTETAPEIPRENQYQMVFFAEGFVSEEPSEKEDDE